MTKAQKAAGKAALAELREVGGLESSAYHLQEAAKLRTLASRGSLHPDGSAILLRMYGDHWRRLARRAVKSARYWRAEVYYPNPQRLPV